MPNSTETPTWDGPAELAKMEAKREEHRRKAIAALTDSRWGDAKTETKLARDCDTMARAIRRTVEATPPPFATERFGPQHVGMEVMTAWSPTKARIADILDDEVVLAWPSLSVTRHRFDDGTALVEVPARKP